MKGKAAVGTDAAAAPRPGDGQGRGGCLAARWVSKEAQPGGAPRAGNAASGLHAQQLGPRTAPCGPATQDGPGDAAGRPHLSAGSGLPRHRSWPLAVRLRQGCAAAPEHGRLLWRKARTAAGCGTVKLHDLRHFYASGLIAAGCDVVTVQRALGHASATVTLTTYAHLWPTAEDCTRAAAASMLAETLSAADSVRTAGQA
ncbi:MAG TPA: tyrosine-type recombinase/integrase [Streptosporangiaceae bacterium]|nr:tyrosine-type recombinase/integrase [Streptosporangiaceae bacterium]